MSDDGLVLNIVGGGPPGDPKKEVIGRNSFIIQLVEHLSRGSVQMYAPRRMGKSWVLHLLKVNGPPEVKTIYMDLEEVFTFYELIEKIGTEAGLFLPRIEAAIGKILEHAIKGWGRAKNYEFHWKTHLEKIFKKINDDNTPVWFLFDEFPILINNLKNKIGPQAATEFLDFFRYIRQECPSLKFVLTGSIGLHWIVDDLEQSGWRNPHNDVARVTLRPLEVPDATLLAEGLFRGFGLEIKKAEELGQAVSGHPFYIQKAVAHWNELGPEENISDFCDRLAQKVEDPFEFNDLFKRIGQYFGRDSKLALRVMDTLVRQNSISIKEIARELKQDPEDILSILGKLEMDGYIEKNEKHYQIYFPVFQRWWVAKRGGMYE